VIFDYDNRETTERVRSHMAEQRFASLPLNGSLKDRLTADLFHSVIRLTQGALFLLQPLSVSSRILARPSRRGPGIRKFDKWTAGSISSFAPGIVAAMSSLCSGRATVSYWPAITRAGERTKAIVETSAYSTARSDGYDRDRHCPMASDLRKRLTIPGFAVLQAY